MKNHNCIFCKIANGEIPSYTLYEDEIFRVICDLNPAVKGHSLIIPKEHYTDIFDLDEGIASKVFVLAKKIAAVMKDQLQCDGFNILQNSGEAGGQTVSHFHMHLIPRIKGDKAYPQPKSKAADTNDLAIFADMIRAALSE